MPLLPPAPPIVGFLTTEMCVAPASYIREGIFAMFAAQYLMRVIRVLTAFKLYPYTMCFGAFLCGPVIRGVLVWYERAHRNHHHPLVELALRIPTAPIIMMPLSLELPGLAVLLYHQTFVKFADPDVYDTCHVVIMLIEMAICACYRGEA